MPKAVFMGAELPIHNVYSASIIEKLKTVVSFPTEHVIAYSEMEEYRAILAEVEFIYSTWGMPCLTEDEIRSFLPKLRAVFYGAGTVQKFARPFLSCGVKIFSAWAANAVPVAEYTAAVITLASKGFFQRLHRQHLGADWTHSEPPLPFPGNYEIKVGVIGAGMIGKLVIEKLRALDKIETLVFDPFLPDETAKRLGVTKVSLETLFSESDVISNHLADNAETRGMLNGKMFSLMKCGSVFINTGRGAQVDEGGLIAALIEPDTYRAAVLDVTDPEPPREDSPLYTLDNVFLTPHIAGSSGNEVHRMAEYMYEETCGLISGEPTRYEVTLKMLETMA